MVHGIHDGLILVFPAAAVPKGLVRIDDVLSDFALTEEAALC